MIMRCCEDCKVGVRYGDPPSKVHKVKMEGFTQAFITYNLRAEYASDTADKGVPLSLPEQHQMAEQVVMKLLETTMKGESSRYATFDEDDEDAQAAREAAEAEAA